MNNIEVIVGRHDERIKCLEVEYCRMEKLLQKIFFTLATLVGGMVVSLFLLILNLRLGR